MRADAGLRFEDVSAGDELQPLVRGPITTAHVMRWSAAIENWHRIHYDKVYAMEHDKLPNVVVTPHVAWLTQETLARCLAVFAENCRRLRSSEPLLNRVV